ncbi:hypothetical protein LXL04_006075 [Taraxacum kok-saghyz]
MNSTNSLKLARESETVIQQRQQGNTNWRRATEPELAEAGLSARGRARSVAGEGTVAGGCSTGVGIDLQEAEARVDLQEAEAGVDLQEAVVDLRG